MVMELRLAVLRAAGAPLQVTMYVTLLILRDKWEQQATTIDHFTVVCSVTWPLNDIEARGDLVLIQTSLLFLCKSSCSNAN